MAARVKCPSFTPGDEKTLAGTSHCFLDLPHGVKHQSPEVVAGLTVYLLLAIFLPCPTFLPSYCYFLHSSRNYLLLPSCFSMFLERSTLRWMPAPSPVLVLCPILLSAPVMTSSKEPIFSHSKKKPSCVPLLATIQTSSPLSLSTSLQSVLYAANFSSSLAVICLLHPSLLKLFSSKSQQWPSKCQT